MRKRGAEATSSGSLIKPLEGLVLLCIGLGCISNAFADDETVEYFDTPQTQAHSLAKQATFSISATWPEWYEHVDEGQVGTGFVAYHPRIFVTARHNVFDESGMPPQIAYIWVDFLEGRVAHFDGRLSKCRTDRDICYMVLKEPIRGVQPLDIHFTKGNTNKEVTDNFLDYFSTGSGKLARVTVAAFWENENVTDSLAVQGLAPTFADCTIVGSDFNSTGAILTNCQLNSGASGSANMAKIGENSSMVISMNVERARTAIRSGNSWQDPGLYTVSLPFDETDKQNFEELVEKL